MKVAFVAALALAVSGCGAYQFGGGAATPSPALATVSGHVVAVPCAPVEKVGSPCAGRPVANLEIDYVAGATVEARTLTNADGSYAVALKPGSYTVRFKNSLMRVISGPLSLTLAAGSNVTANYTLDSGIRVPAPAQ
ncbi:MAG TPA: hypothetical protein VFL27_03665 [Candidatus Dormibacteraeota bacterium]|nr:hypothetical protein [Candidatus Dormibacteraeota bacterium]